MKGKVLKLYTTVSIEQTQKSRRVDSKEILLNRNEKLRYVQVKQKNAES